MNRNRKRVAIVAAAAMLLLVAGSCNDINRQESPVSLIVSDAQKLHLIDLAGDPPGSSACQQTVDVVKLTTATIQPSPTNPNLSAADLNQVKIDRYQVSYVRADGGHLVPRPFVRSVAIVIAAGGTGDPGTLQLVEPAALNQAPFAALLPQNGGVDPETGKRIITMDVITTFFGQTLAGSRVSGSARITLDFCFSCGGCS